MTRVRSHGPASEDLANRAGQDSAAIGANVAIPAGLANVASLDNITIVASIAFGNFPQIEETEFRSPGLVLSPFEAAC